MGIKKIRHELGLTQADFAKLFGVHQTAVSQWETGRTMPDLETVINIVRATGYSMEEILDIHTGSMRFREDGFDFQMPDGSMRLARIMKDDRVYVKHADIKDGAMVAVQRNETITARYLRLSGGEKYFVTAECPARIERMTDSDRILGRVFGFYSEIGLFEEKGKEDE